jgi:hypothetical protein
MKYFVLSPLSSDVTHALASIKAMEAYADEIGRTDHQRAVEINTWAAQCRLELTRQTLEQKE